MPLTSAHLPRLVTAIRATGVGIDGVDINGRVTPTSLQSAAQATIDAFNTSQSAQDAWNAQVQQKTLGRQNAVRKSADQGTTSASFVDVDDLLFQLFPNTHYAFRFTGAYTAALNTTGLQLSVNGPASPSFIRFVGRIFTSQIALAGGAAAAYDVALAPTASAGSTAIPFDVEGSISTGSTGGTFRLRFRSSVAGSTVTILRGSLGFLSAAT